MSPVGKSIVTLLKFIVYSTMFVVGATLLVVDPTSPFRVLPVLVGVGLLVHAISRDEVRRIEYTIVGLYATLAVLVVMIAVAAAAAVSVPSVLTADATLSVVVTLVIAGVYFGQRYATSRGERPV
jgi:hypothetical protein